MSDREVFSELVLWRKCSSGLFLELTVECDSIAQRVVLRRDYVTTIKEIPSVIGFERCSNFCRTSCELITITSMLTKLRCSIVKSDIR